MNRLERRYRALLGVLPRDYRAQREEEMVDTFLAARRGGPGTGACPGPDGDTDHGADLDGEYGWPGWSETAATLALAARVRLGGSVGLVAALGLVFGVAVAAASAVSAVPGPPGTEWPLWTLAHLASAGALVAAARGARAEAVALAGVPVGVGLAAMGVGAAVGAGGAPWQPALTAALLLPPVVTVVALCVDEPPSGTRWLWAGGGAAAVGACLPPLGLDPVTLAPAALAVVALFVPRRAVLVLAAALLPHAVLSVSLPGGPAPWPLLGFAAVAVSLAARRVRRPRGARPQSWSRP